MKCNFRWVVVATPASLADPRFRRRFRMVSTRRSYREVQRVAGVVPEGKVPDSGLGGEDGAGGGGGRLRCDDALGDDTQRPDCCGCSSVLPLLICYALSQGQRAPLLITPCLLSDVHTCLRNILLPVYSSVESMLQSLCQHM